MALKPILKYFIYNGELKPIKKFIPSENDGGIYEVLRVVNGMPLFLDEHLERFFKSAEIAGKKILFSKKEIIYSLNLLIVKNEVEIGNILISCKNNLKVFFIPHVYPTDEQYSSGVSCGILYAERANPNAKVFQTSVRQQANTLITENGFYEVLLADKNEVITEGSRSNVFFIKGTELITTKASKVLLGITRMKTLQCAETLNIVVRERDVKLKDLTDYDAAFLTGTSLGVLPIKSVGELTFNVGDKVLRQLMVQFNSLIVKSIITKLP